MPSAPTVALACSTAQRSVPALPSSRIDVTRNWDGTVRCSNSSSRSRLTLRIGRRAGRPVTRPLRDLSQEKDVMGRSFLRVGLRSKGGPAARRPSAGATSRLRLPVTNRGAFRIDSEFLGWLPRWSGQWHDGEQTTDYSFVFASSSAMSFLKSSRARSASRSPSFFMWATSL